MGAERWNELVWLEVEMGWMRTYLVSGSSEMQAAIGSNVYANGAQSGPARYMDMDIDIDERVQGDRNDPKTRKRTHS